MTESTLTRSNNQRGFTVIESIVALGMLGMIGVVFLMAISVGFRGRDINKEHLTAENLVRAQLEDIRNQPYQDSYTVSVSLSPGYSITIDTQPYCTPEPCIPDNNIQQNIVAVFREAKPVVAITDLKTRR